MKILFNEFRRRKIENFSLEGILNPEQRRFMQKELVARSLVLDQEGKIDLSPGVRDGEEMVDIWKKKEGVIDAIMCDGSMIVIYNSDKRVPEGCRDLRHIESHNGIGRGGEYNPETEVCSVDISNTWDYIENRYEATWAQQIARHELRHAFVHHLDMERFRTLQKPSSRNLHVDQLNLEDYQQLAYLDELHGQFMDAIEGAIEGVTSFRKIEENFYSTALQGDHLKVASNTNEGKEAAATIFLVLQIFILSQRMREVMSLPTIDDKIDTICVAAGAVLATERSLQAALTKLQALLALLQSDKQYMSQMKTFLTEYTPSLYSDNTPEITPKLSALF